MFAVLFFLSGVVVAFFCAFLAAEKNRSTFAWFFLGFFFSLVALLTLAGAPQKPGS